MALIEGTDTSLFIKNGTQSMQWLVMQGESPFSPPKSGESGDLSCHCMFHAISCPTCPPSPTIPHHAHSIESLRIRHTLSLLIMTKLMHSLHIHSSFLLNHDTN